MKPNLKTKITFMLIAILFCLISLIVLGSAKVFAQTPNTVTPVVAPLCSYPVPAALNILPAQSITPAYTVLKDISKGTMGGNISSVWQALLNLVNGFVIVVIIVIAFAEILRLNINTYGVKKMLPTLILAVIASNFSFLFCRLMIDLANIVMVAIIHGTTGGALASAMNGGLSGQWAHPCFTSFQGANSNLNASFGTVFLFGLMQLLLIASGVIIYVLAFLFFIRLWLIYFLVALAPLPFMAMVLPQSKNLFNQWMSNFLKWVFMPVVSVFWIWLGSQWLGVINKEGWFLQVLFGGVCFYLAITTPFKMGGAIMNTWNGLGKRVWNRTGGAAWNATGGAGINAARTGINTRYDRQKQKLKNRFYQGGIPGTARLASYMTNSQARQKFLTQQEQDVFNKRQSDAERDVYVRAYTREFLNRAQNNPQMNDAAYARAIAKIRTTIGGERETYSNLVPSAIERSYRQNHGIDLTTGKVKSEAQMAADVQAGRMTPDEMIQTKAVTNRARQLLNNTISRGDTRDVMGYTDPLGVIHPGLIPDQHVDTWYSGDIARAQFSSAVGSVSQEVQTELSKTLGSPANAQKFINAAQFGNGNLDDAISNVRVVGLTLKGQKDMEGSFNAIRGDKMDRINELKEIGNQNVEDRMAGIREVLPHNPLNKESFATFKTEFDSIKKGMNEGNLDETAKKLNVVGISNKDELKATINKRISNVETGIQHFDQLNQRMDAMGSGGDAVRKRIAAAAKNNGEEYANKIEQGMKKDVEASAHATVAAKLATQSLASNPKLTVSQMASDPAALEVLAQAAKGAQHDLQVSGKPLDKETIVKTLNESIKNGLVDASTNIEKAKDNDAFINNLANAMKKTLQGAPVQTPANPPKAPTTPANNPAVNPGDKPNVA